MGTGGGPPPKPEILTDINAKIRDILGVRVEELNSEFGGDAGNEDPGGMYLKKNIYNHLKAKKKLLMK